MAKKNFTISVVATAPSPATTGTSLVVTAGTGSLFAVNEPAIIFPALEQPIGTNAEIVMVTSVSTDTLTIEREQEGTSARTVIVGDNIIQGITARDWGNVNSPPTDLKVSTESKGGVFNSIDKATGDTARTSSGWIEDEKYGWWGQATATAWSSEFDSAVQRTGKFTIKLSTTDITGRVEVYSAYGPAWFIPVKSSTTYKLNCYVKTNNAESVTGVRIRFSLYTSSYSGIRTVTSVGLKGTNDWTLITLSFTTSSIGKYGVIKLSNMVAGNVSDAWFDVNSMTLEEVVTDDTFTGKVAESVRPVLQAVTSTDNIDRNLDRGGAYANTYAITTAINEGATHRQTFTPTKKYITQIGVWVVDKGSGDWTVAVHTAGNVLVASKEIANADLTNSAFNYFDIPNIWTSGALHFHVYSTVADGTLKSNTNNNLEAGSYIQRYAKKSEGFTLVVNGIKTELEADKDGLLTGAIIDLDNGKYRYENPFNILSNFVDEFSASVGGGTTIPVVVNGWDWANTLESIQSASGATARDIVLKVNTVLPIKHLRLTPTMFNNNVLGGTFAISTDNVNYTTLKTLTQSASTQTEILETDIMNGVNIFYIKFAKSTENTYLRIDNLEIEADLDTSSIPAGLLYPFSTNQFTETVKLPSVATRIYYRLNKFTNEHSVVTPALEYTDASGNNIGYTPLKLDNSQETNPSVAIIFGSTTNGQAVGTGSEQGANYILTDGEYMTLSTAINELSVVYKVGKGTTAFTNITKNTLYLSSNGESDDSTQDPSHQGNFIIGARQQGLVDRVKDIGEEVEEMKKPMLYDG